MIQLLPLIDTITLETYSRPTSCYSGNCLLEKHPKLEIVGNIEKVYHCLDTLDFLEVRKNLILFSPNALFFLKGRGGAFVDTESRFSEEPRNIVPRKIFMKRRKI